jgi:predicted nucleotidyltransferase component of viral defense system
MTQNSPGLRSHEDTDRFQDALQHTAATLGFRAALIEKDYFCSVVLQALGPAFDDGLVFKGGTCLSKVHAGFFRISEDLDLVVPIAEDARRSERRKRIEPHKTHFDALAKKLGVLQIEKPLDGRNLSKQYVGRLTYRSVVSGQTESIKIEIALREPAIDPIEKREAQTVLIDPSGTSLPSVVVSTLSTRELYAEKLRAALTRRDPQIRDFFDVDHAVRKEIVDFDDQGLIDLLRKKLMMPGNQPPDCSDARYEALRMQLGAQLEPVLRAEDFQAFDLDRAFEAVKRVNAALAK